MPETLRITLPGAWRVRGRPISASVVEQPLLFAGSRLLSNPDNFRRQ